MFEVLSKLYSLQVWLDGVYGFKISFQLWISNEIGAVVSAEVLQAGSYCRQAALALHLPGLTSLFIGINNALETSNVPLS